MSSYERAAASWEAARERECAERPTGKRLPNCIGCRFHRKVMAQAALGVCGNTRAVMFNRHTHESFWCIYTEPKP